MSFTSWLYDVMIDPFVSFYFLRRPLIACVAIALGCGPMGILLILRRMILMGDAISHAILPGAALGFLMAGLSVTFMGIGGALAGLAVALAAGGISRWTPLKEDASLAGFYLISMAAGIILISTRGGNVDLMCVLLGNILSISDSGLILTSALSSFTLIVLAIIYRPLIIECCDPGFLRSIGGRGHIFHFIFLTLLVLNLVSAFQAIGTLMALGLMMLPAIAARFWARDIWTLSAVGMLITMISAYIGLLISYHAEWPSGPSIIIVAGGIYLLSIFFGRCGGLISYLMSKYLRKNK